MTPARVRHALLAVACAAGGDTLAQERVKISELSGWIQERLR